MIYAKTTGANASDERRMANRKFTLFVRDVQGGKAVSRRWEKLQRVLADAPGDVAKDSDDARACIVHYCMRVRACVWAGLLELSSAYLRCTMHSLSLPTLGRQGEANSSLYRSSARKNSLLRSSRRTLGGWLSKYNTQGCWEKNINFEDRSYVMIYDLPM